MARNYRRISSYITKEILFAFFVTFLFFLIVFVLNTLLLIAKRLMLNNINVVDVIMLLIYSLPGILVLSFPFASLVGGLMAMSRFSSSNEIIAIQASGISMTRFFLPFFFVGILLTFTSFFLNDFLLPLGNIEYNKLFRRLIQTAPELEIDANSIKKYQDSILITGNINDKQIDDLIIIDKDGKQQKRIIVSQKARLEENKAQAGVLSLELTDVFSNSFDPKIEQDYDYINSEKMTYNILLNDFTDVIQKLTPREMSTIDVYKLLVKEQTVFNQRKKLHQKSINRKYADFNQDYYYCEQRLNSMSLEEIRMLLDPDVKSIQGLESRVLTDRELSTYKLDLNRKFSLPVACILFMFFSFLVGLFLKSNNAFFGFGLGLLISLVYWLLLFIGHSIGIRSNFSPFLSMWFPNFIILLVGGIFFLYRLKR